jgi:hypothetical protein
MSLKRSLAVPLLAGLLGCASANPMDARLCSTDSECGEGQVCFMDGCGDPGQGLVVEVTGNTLLGQYAQDFPLADGGVAARLDFVLRTPLVLEGELRRELTASVDPGNRAVYADAVLLRAMGESEFLPGVTRSFEARFDEPAGGLFALPLGAGRYTVSAAPADTSIPPAFMAGVLVRAEETPPMLRFAFPSVEGTVILAGRVLKERGSLPASFDVAVTSAAVDIQAFDPDTRQPLSQRVPVASGTPSSRGEFALSMSPLAATLAGVQLVVSPRQASALVPNKVFRVTAPLPKNVTLELGEFGEPAVGVRAQVIDARGGPVAGASVIVEGVAAGGGSFRTPVAHTDATGWVSLDVLQNASGMPFQLTVLPPPESAAALTQTLVRVERRPGEPAAFVPALVRCGERVSVVGHLLRPDGSSAAGVLVRAVQQPSGTERALSRGDGQAESDGTGRFTLGLDEGTYRFDFVPSGDAARSSRGVVVPPPADGAGGGRPPLDLNTISLPNGRRLVGTVSATSNARAQTVVPYAALRFFRVSRIEGKPASILIAQSVADGRGQYSVLLPTRSSTGPVGGP